MVRRSGSNGLVLTYRRNRPTPTSRTWLRARWHFPRTWMVCPSPPGGAALLDAVPVLSIPGSYPLASFSLLYRRRVPDQGAVDVGSCSGGPSAPRRMPGLFIRCGSAVHLPPSCVALLCSSVPQNRHALRFSDFPVVRLPALSGACSAPRVGAFAHSDPALYLDTGRFHFRRSAPCPTSQVRPPGFASHPLWLYCRLRLSRLPRSLCAASGPLSARPLRVSGSRSLRRLPRRVVDALDLALERCPCSFSSTP